MKKYFKFLAITLFVLLITSCGNKEDVYYEVKFDTGGGTIIPTQTVKKGGTVERPADPIKEGYKFIAWQNNYVNYNFNEKVKSNLKLVAKWEKMGSTTQPNIENDTPKNNEQPKQVDSDKPVENNKPVDNKDTASILAKSENFKFNIGIDKDITELFTIDYGKSKGTVTCLANDKNVSNLKTLNAGKYIVICALKTNDNKIFKDATNVEIVNNIKTETIKLSSTNPTQNKSIIIENLDRIIDYKVDKGTISISKEKNKINITVKGNTVPNCTTKGGYFEKLYYTDGSKCSTYYLYTYVNGIITDAKCIEVSCKSSVINPSNQNLYHLDEGYTNSCKCPSESVVKSVIGTRTGSNLNEVKKIPLTENSCVYSYNSKWVESSTTCNYEYIVTLTYMVK